MEIQLDHLETALSGPLSGMSEYKQFILWKPVWDAKKSKWNKVPVNYRTLQKVSPLDPETWLEARTAISWARVWGGLGVGFTFTEADPFFFLDIDKALKGDNTWSEFSQKLVASFPGAACEVSMSGTGLHVFGKSEKIPHSSRSKENGLEFYTEKRFVALTGYGAIGDCRTDQTPVVSKLVKRFFPAKSKDTTALALPSGEGILTHPEFDTIWTATPIAKDYGIERSDETLIKYAMTVTSKKAKEGKACPFDALFNGDFDTIRKFYPGDGPGGIDESKADFALATHLMFFTGGNCEQVKRLMLASCLCREKFTDRRDYLEKFTLPNAFQTWSSSGAETFKKGRIQAEGNPSPGSRDQPIEHKVAPMGGAGYLLGMGYNSSFMGFPDISPKGRVKSTYANFLRLIEESEVTVRFNEMKHETEIDVPGCEFYPGDELDSAVTVLESLAGATDFPTGNIERFIKLHAQRNSYHPVKEWIESQKWDGIDRISLLVDSLDSERRDLTEIFITRWMIAAIAGLYEKHGVIAQGMPVLQGPQNAGKSRWIAALVEGNGEFAKGGALLNPNDKDSVKQSIAYWIVELAELDGTFKKADIEALKAFITNNKDEYRAAYDRRESKRYRRTVFAASVNPRQYLNDDTGNRRFWTIAVGTNLNPDHGVDMTQAWAQARELYFAGERHFLDAREIQLLNEYNKKFEVTTAELDVFQRKYDVNGPRDRPMTVTEVLQEMGFDIQRTNIRKTAHMIANALGLGGAEMIDGKMVFMMPRLKNENGETVSARTALLRPVK